MIHMMTPRPGISEDKVLVSCSSAVHIWRLQSKACKVTVSDLTLAQPFCMMLLCLVLLPTNPARETGSTGTVA